MMSLDDAPAESAYAGTCRGARVLAVVILGPIAGACSSGDASNSGESSMRTDSVGIEIVVNLRPAWSNGEGWRIDSEPSIGIGQAEGSADETFSGIVAVRRMGDSILVAQPTDVRIFGSDGGLGRRVGRPGAGPGEFGYLLDALACAGGLVTSDWLPVARLTLYPPSGELVSIALPPEQGMSNPLRPLLMCTESGVLGVQYASAITYVDSSETVRIPGFLVDLSLEGEGVDSLLEFAGPENFSGMTVPFGRFTMPAAAGDHLYLADNATPEIRVLNRGGELRRIIRIPIPERRVTAADIERVRALYLEGGSDESRARMTALLDAVSFHETMPWFSLLQTGADGALWLHYYQPFFDEPVSRWMVIDSTGVWLGDVDVPPGFTPYEFGDGEVLGVWRDDLGIEYVHGYAIR